MITLVDNQGHVTLIPSNRLISIKMEALAPGEASPEIAVKCVITYDGGLKKPSDLVYYFTASEVQNLKQTLLGYATSTLPGAPGQLLFFNSSIRKFPTLSETENIAI